MSDGAIIIACVAGMVVVCVAMRILETIEAIAKTKRKEDE
jgi:hypothetical protein